MCHVRHGLTGLRALTTSTHALFHVAYTFTAIGARLANLCANCAHYSVKIRSRQHEPGAHEADVGTIEHQAQMTGFDMFPPHLKTMRSGHLKANVMTAAASGDALLRAGGYR